MSLNINLETKQKLIVSQRLQQQLSILHMTLQEVAELASEQMQSNPLLEMQENAPADEVFSNVSLDALSKKQGQEAARENETAEEMRSLYSSNYRAGKGSQQDGGSDFLDYSFRPESLQEYLTMQLVSYPLTETQKNMCRYLIESLDERGFFSESLEWIAETYGVDLFELTQMLYVIQSLDPPGIGARDLEECLILQLAESDRFNGHTVRIVKEMLPLLSQNKISAIAKCLGVDVGEAERCCQAVRSLSPIPARGYYTGGESGYIVPDAIVMRRGTDFVVQMNDSMIPHLVVCEEYANMLSSSDDENLRNYVKENLAAAKNLITDIDARKKTLYALICTIVKKQPEFFADGKTLRPMVMGEIAEELEMHVSTISRAIRGKYIVCAAGTVSLRSLFTAGYGAQGTDAVSAAVVKRKLVELISAEDRGAPLSDDALCKIFTDMNIKISRRTVAKYREEQGIPSSRQRKENWA